MRGAVELRFEEGYAPVRVRFEDQGIHVEDGGEGDWTPDLVIAGALPDIVHLAAAPLAGGVPKPTSAHGRSALAKVAGRKVRLEGSAQLGRRLLQLLQLSS